MQGAGIRNSKIHRTSKVEAGSFVINSTFDRYSFCGYDCNLINCSIGSFTSIANRVVIGGARHPMEWVSMSPVFYEGRDSVKTKFSEHKRELPLRTQVGHDVWIGEGAIIKAGVTVGYGAVVGMGAVVTKNIGAFEIWAGNPAKLIRKRFDDQTISKLLEIAWWNFNDSQLRQYAYLFNTPELFLKECAKTI